MKGATVIILTQSEELIHERAERLFSYFLPLIGPGKERALRRTLLEHLTEHHNATMELLVTNADDLLKAKTLGGHVPEDCTVTLSEIIRSIHKL